MKYALMAGGLLMVLMLGRCTLAAQQAQNEVQKIPQKALLKEEPTPKRLQNNMSSASDIGSRLGGGNFTDGDTNAETQMQFGILNTLGARGCRINVYPSSYLEQSHWGQPNAHALDAVMKQARANDVTPIILFEFYAEYITKNKMEIGTSAQWAKLGQAFAERYRPNGTWGKENHIKDWGVTIYTAFNEPDNTAFKAGGALGPVPYVTALKGLADGVHSVDKSLRVLPGGFMDANAFADWKLGGLGPALAPLWNDGTLDGIDLHTYYDVQYAPMENTYQRSAQHNFDAIKKECGITRDIAFYTTEFNYKKRIIDESQAARGFLTGIWDNLGMVKNDGKTPAGVIAFPWNIFHATGQDTEFGLIDNLNPLTFTQRGKVLENVLKLTRGMSFTSLDPRAKGEFVLAGAGKKLWVWQDRKTWTDHFGSTYTLTSIPKEATQITVYGWDGIRQTLPVSHASKLTITNLPGDETYMFLATNDQTTKEMAK